MDSDKWIADTAYRCKYDTNRVAFACLVGVRDLEKYSETQSLENCCLFIFPIDHSVAVRAVYQRFTRLLCCFEGQRVLTRCWFCLFMSEWSGWRIEAIFAFRTYQNKFSSKGSDIPFTYRKLKKIYIEHIFTLKTLRISLTRWRKYAHAYHCLRQ